MIHGPPSHNDGRGHTQSDAYTLHAFVLDEILFVQIIDLYRVRILKTTMIPPIYNIYLFQNMIVKLKYEWL